MKESEKKGEPVVKNIHHLVQGPESYLGRGKGTKVKLLAPFRLDSCWPWGRERRRRAQIHPRCNTRGSRRRSLNLKVEEQRIKNISAASTHMPF